jgi:hypothetical protein
MKTKVTKVAPRRVVVGPSYYLASGIIRSRTQFDRLRKSGRIRPLFNIGSRIGQWQDIADEDLAGLINQPENDEHEAGEDEVAPRGDERGAERIDDDDQQAGRQARTNEHRRLIWQ